MTERSGPHRLPRLLTIMGSGETAPTMVKVHRSVVERLAASPAAGGGGGSGTDGRAAVHGLLLDTPFGFQTNAAEIAARAVTYFRESVGAALEVAGLRSAADLAGARGDRVVTRLAQLPLVFAGPGSPSYALRQWRGSLVPSLLAEKLTLGGALTFASAAALTLGSATVPVYEVYKVGEDPHWLEGLDLLRPLGLPAILIPHYDNAEGQTHDTRFCYLGEERLSRMEQDLEEGTFVLGVDEHTALCMDLDARSATVVGRGGVTVRVRGRSARIESGETVLIGRLLEMADALGSPPRAGAAPLAARGTAGPVPEPGDVAKEATVPTRRAESPLLQAIRNHESAFRDAREASDPAGMVAALLALEEELWAWRADTLQSDEMDRGRASLRTMIAELGRVAETGARDPAELIAPYVDVAVAARDSARREHRFAEADAVRDRLLLLGVAVHDTPEGSTWELQRDRLGNAGPRAPAGAGDEG